MAGMKRSSPTAGSATGRFTRGSSWSISSATPTSVITTAPGRNGGTSCGRRSRSP